MSALHAEWTKQRTLTATVWLLLTVIAATVAGRQRGRGRHALPGRRLRPGSGQDHPPAA